MSDLCPKCGHDQAEHDREVEAIVFNIEKHNEIAAVLECGAREGTKLCGCRYVDLTTMPLPGPELDAEGINSLVTCTDQG